MLTVNGALDAINRFSNYLDDAINGAPYVELECNIMGLSQAEEVACREYRISNFIVALLNGTKNQNLQHAPALLEYVTRIQSRHMNHSLVVTASNKWDWDVIREELKILWINERVWFTRIYLDMQERIIEKDKTSPDMLRFKGLMDEINRIP